MITISKRRSLWCAALMCLSTTLVGCSTYSRVGQSFRHHQTKLVVTLPEGWLRFNPARPTLSMTHNGLRLERIDVMVTQMGKKLAGTKRVYRPGMLPHEVAELSLGLIEADETTKNFNIKDIQLGSVAGHEGYRAEAAFVDQQGLAKRLRLHGVVIGEHVCEFRYVAAEHVYFDRYAPAFETLVTSARVETP